MISVSIVEYNAGLQRSLNLLLGETPGFRCVGSYTTAEEALRQIPKHPAEVVLMDSSPHHAGRRAFCRGASVSDS